MPERTQRNPIESASEQVKTVVGYFESRELNGGKIQKYTFTQRLIELEENRPVPIVVFNCIYFNYSPNPNGGYPLYTALESTEKPITSFYLPNIIESLNALSSLGPANPFVIIPDSELLDERVFPFTQNKEEREAIVSKIKIDLETIISEQATRPINVLTWSEYCQINQIPYPVTYTEEAFLRNIQIEIREGTIGRQMQDSFQFFLDKGIDYLSLARIEDAEFEERIKWYCAMYAGEGRALQDTGAIVLNFEDLRVRKWLRIGSEGQLPVLTPVPTLSEYKKWRSA